MASAQDKFGFHFDNTYAGLPDVFFARLNPIPVRAPQTVVLNSALAQELGLNSETLSSDDGARFFSGNEIPPGAEPLAQAYAGHQFGHFTMLGDGRAILLGEQLSPNGARFDIQLKGSGRTPFSRGGDGRAALGPMLREYIVSEAMHALNIPTTRSLAVVTTGESVYRERELPGAILTRVAASHIRVGTFEYAAARREIEDLRRLADYTIQRHYPDLASSPEPYLSVFQAILQRQAELISKWMQVGFIHGVMNTDNMALSGETIDYGPCAFMDQYSPRTVFSSIDRNGRYAYGNQPFIAGWNLTCLAESLVPLISSDLDEGVRKVEEALQTFAPLYEKYWRSGLLQKLGIEKEQEGDKELIASLLQIMEKHGADFTNTFRDLSLDTLPNQTFYQQSDFQDWRAKWEARGPSQVLMRSVNPAVIPRNHKVEEALSAAVERNDLSLMERLLDRLKRPFEDGSENEEYRTPPPSGSEPYRTFCGT